MGSVARDQQSRNGLAPSRLVQAATSDWSPSGTAYSPRRERPPARPTSRRRARAPAGGRRRFRPARNRSGIPMTDTFEARCGAGQVLEHGAAEPPGDDVVFEGHDPAILRHPFVQPGIEGLDPSGVDDPAGNVAGLQVGGDLLGDLDHPSHRQDQHVLPFPDLLPDPDRDRGRPAAPAATRPRPSGIGWRSGRRGQWRSRSSRPVHGRRPGPPRPCWGSSSDRRGRTPRDGTGHRVR